MEYVIVFILAAILGATRERMISKCYSKEDMIKAAKYGYEFHKLTQFPEQDFEDSCINNTKQWLEHYK